MSHPFFRTAFFGFVLFVSGAGLAWLWFDAEGQIKNSQWQKPPLVAAIVPAIAIHEPAGVGQDETTLNPILERPLFAVDRKVPPPPAPPPPPPLPPPPDALNGAHLFGLIAGEEGFIILRSEGKIRNIKLNESVGNWVLKNIQERSARFERNDEKRTLTLEYAKLGVPVNAAAPALAGIAGAPILGGPANPSAELEDRRKRREAMRSSMQQ